jgi:hypothetical protein
MRGVLGRIHGAAVEVKTPGVAKTPSVNKILLAEGFCSGKPNDTRTRSQECGGSGGGA